MYVIQSIGASISIHALAKRATFFGTFKNNAPIDFNPRPRKEGDLCLTDDKRKYWYFNPRPRKEGDKSL